MNVQRGNGDCGLPYFPRTLDWSDELCGQGDRGPGECLADGAVLLGVLGRRGEAVRVQAWYFGADGEVDPGDALTRLEGDVGLRLQTGRWCTSPGQAVGERH